MELLTSLPLAKVDPTKVSQGLTSETSKARARKSEEGEGLCFAGILERSQAIVRPGKLQSGTGETDGSAQDPGVKAEASHWMGAEGQTESKPLPAATTTAVDLIPQNSQLMIGQMLKFQLQGPASTLDNLAGTNPAGLMGQMNNGEASVPAGPNGLALAAAPSLAENPALVNNPALATNPALADIRPTGDQGQAASALDVSALKEAAQKQGLAITAPENQPTVPSDRPMVMTPAAASPAVSTPPAATVASATLEAATSASVSLAASPLAESAPMETPTSTLAAVDTAGSSTISDQSPTAGLDKGSPVPSNDAHLATGFKSPSTLLHGVGQSQVSAIGIPTPENQGTNLATSALEIPANEMPLVIDAEGDFQVTKLGNKSLEPVVETAVGEVAAPDISGTDPAATEGEGAAGGQTPADQSPLSAAPETQINNESAVPVGNVPQEAPDQLPAGSLVNELDSGAVRPRTAVAQSLSSTRIANLDQGQMIRQQVIQELSSGLDGKIGNEKITLQLNPENLGQVEIQFSAKNNDLSIVITASSKEAQLAIREGTKELAEGIADKSARWQQVDIKVDQRGQEQDKSENRQENRREQSRRENSQSNQQDQNKRSQNGGPDWASLTREG